MTTPYAPTPLDTPLINPSVGGYGVPFPYLSCSEYNFAPTAMDTATLIEGGDAVAQTRSLADVITRASRWADRYCFGADPAPKGASLCATQNVEQGYFKMLRGELRLICDFKPIIELSAIDIGVNAANLAPLTQAVASGAWFGSKVIHIPGAATSVSFNGFPDTLPGVAGWGQSNRVYAVWAYVSGYPHTQLAASVEAESSTVIVAPTSALGSLYGVYPGTQLTIMDGTQSESFVVESISGATISTVSPLIYDHTVPDAPDFLPVTALPEDVTQAVIFLTTALIKTRGDNSITLDEITEPTKEKSTADDVTEDVTNAFDLLDPFRVVTKIKS